MFNKLRDALKIKEIRVKLLFTLLMIIIIRIGCQLPVPGVDPNYFRDWFNKQTSDAFNFLDAFTGGSFLNMSLLALNITPYITSSIIMQLLTIAIPALEEMQKEGGEGRKKIASITRYVTVALALIESAAMTISFGQGGLLREYNALNIITAIVALTSGSAFVMWIGERITEKGIGNGISIILLVNIIARIPQDMQGLISTFVTGKPIATQVLAIVVILAILVAMVMLVVLLNSGLRKIPVQYARRSQGSKIGGGTATNIPIRINTAGVIPIIFATSLMQTPGIISSFAGYKGTGVWSVILTLLSSRSWFDKSRPVYTLGILIYIVLVIVFAYFYTSITFNPVELADNLKKSNGFIPGIRPGKPTSDYITNILNAIIFIGAVGLTIVGILPYIFYGVFRAEVTFLGTSLIIVVSVIIETLTQVESMMLVRNYKGFLNQ
ncbi:MAG: preprotein translocase subunit SecY [Lachnospiraceae bacterium]|nr:preprotein translocase subunit SecY [Lachnospiraceae bacterium]MBR5760593.1 preprotein translocase subunit SecY [Lachnospiraceae bacterium]MBR5994844.1 preprotein translocase subunit SecY [Lachnospiraceae bacterium]